MTNFSLAVRLLLLSLWINFTIVQSESNDLDKFMNLMQELNLTDRSSKLNMLNGKAKSAELSNESSSKAQSFQDIFKSIVLNYKPKDREHDYEAKYVVKTEKGNFELTDYNYMILQAFRRKNKYDTSYDGIDDYKVSKDYCPIPSHIPKSCQTYAKRRYRTLDGTCNNLEYPWYGAANTEYIRHLPPHYQDGISDIKGLKQAYGKPAQLSLPHPSKLSLDMFKHHPTESIWSNLLISYGQSVSHDLTNTLNFRDEVDCRCDVPYKEKHDDCIILPVLPYDDYMKHMRKTCIPLYRSAPSFVGYDCSLHHREQVNTVTAYLDLSTIYSKKPDTRSYRYGELKFSINARGEMTHALREKNGCTAYRHNRGPYKGIYHTADVNGEQNVYLTSVEAIWIRNHNRIARMLYDINPHWDDDRLFNEARHINIAIEQHVVFMEFLPNVIGFGIMKKYDLIPMTYGYYMKYDKKLDNQIYNEFATAAFRQHNLVKEKQCLVDKNYRKLGCHKVGWGFLNSNQTCISMDDVIRGQLHERSYHQWPQTAWDMNHDLLKEVDSIVVKNVFRGRDHGIRNYVDYREYCGMGRAKSFDDLIQIPYYVRNQLKSIYYSVDKIDLWVGLASEMPIADGMVGPTASCLIAKQFVRIKRGDRFYYENGNDKVSRFTLPQLNTIRSITYASILCANVDIYQVVKWPFLYHDKYTNPMVDCQKIKHVSLMAWKDDYKYGEKEDYSKKYDDKNDDEYKK